MKFQKAKQRGVSLGGLLFWCVMLGGAALVGMKVFPLYSEKMKVDQAMVNVGGSASGSSTKAELAKAMMRQFEVSDVNRWTDSQFAALLKAGPTGVGRQRAMALDYDLRTPFFGDLDIVLKYHKVVPLPPGDSE